jgi:hypothetical protein
MHNAGILDDHAQRRRILDAIANPFPQVAAEDERYLQVIV